MNTETDESGYEAKDVSVGGLFSILLLLVLCGVVIFVGVAGVMRYLQLHEVRKTEGWAGIPAPATREFPEPRLELNAPADLARLRAAEDADLNSYGWVDRSAGRVRLPISRAMELLLQRGLPDVGHGQTPLSLMQARPAETATPPHTAPK